MRAARQLAIEAGVHIHVRSFQVINQVGAASIDAKLDCDAFASTHSATSHYDRASFVVRARSGALAYFLSRCTHAATATSSIRGGLQDQVARRQPLVHGEQPAAASGEVLLQPARVDGAHRPQRDVAPVRLREAAEGAAPAASGAEL